MNQPLLTAARAAARFGLLAILGTSAIAATAPTTTTTPPKKDEPAKLEKFEVTGSRIKRLDAETPAPVQTFTIESIEAKGYANIGDFIQSLPFNSGTANSIYQTASFTRGAATANPRGLGSNRFLTLINGRRAITYGLTNSANQSVFDFNSIPAAAVDSIEYLKDGASAIYGSDAITGVLNIKLKRNFSGVIATTMYGNTIGHDTGYLNLNAIVGTGVGKTKAVVALDFKTQNSNFLRDYDVTTADYSAAGVKGLNQNSTLNFPANLSLTRAQATAIGLAFPATATTATSWTFVPRGGAQQGTPTVGGFVAAPQNPANPNAVLVGNENRYNFAQSYQRYPAYDYGSAYTSFEHEFTDTLTGFAEITYSNNRTYYAFTPAVINFPTEGLVLPAANPYNPFGIPLTSLTARTNFGPVRKFDTESNSTQFLGGLRGTILNRWNWEMGAAYGSSLVTSVSRNAVRAATYQAGLNGTTLATAINPFGPSAPAALANLFTISSGSNKIEAVGYDAHVDGTLFDLPAGSIGVAAGAEWRRDKIQTNPDTAAYLGSGGGLPLQGLRNVGSVFVEVTVPILRSLEVQAAGRYENYSDFGNTTKPKIGAKYRFPNNQVANVILRGSYSESFKAPDLGRLYASQTIAFSQGVLQDPLRPQDPPQQQRIVTGGNPNLLPETAKVKYAGIVVDIPRIKELSFNIDYFKFQIDQVIVTPGVNFLLTPNGIASFPNAIVRDSALGNPGPILRIETVPSNNPKAFVKYEGMDFGVKYTLRNTRYGNFNFEVNTTRILEVGSDSGLGGGYFNNTGLFVNPKWRGNASIGWRQKDWGFTVNADYIGKYFNDGFVAPGWGENPYTTVHPQISYRGFWNSTIQLGANNVLDNKPPFNGRDTGGFDPNTYGAGALGRFVYVRVRKEF